MKEKLLKAILQILAIVAKDEDVTESEREIIRRFLLENLRENDVGTYLKFFDQATVQFANSNLTQDKEFTRKLSHRLNQELTQAQKVIAMVHLMELIAADGIITETENTLLYFTGECLKIDKATISIIKGFIISNRKEQFNASHVLLIDQEKESNLSCKHMHCSGLNGFIAILYIPSYSTGFIKHLGKNEVYLNGVPLHEHRTINFSPGSVVKVPPHTLYYSDVMSHFSDQKTSNQIIFKAKNLSYTFPNGTVGLRDVSLEETSGKMIAIMGGSGSGKSTLLNILNGNQEPIKGNVTINGFSIYKERNKVAGIIGYVPQDDLLIDELTVFENLYYASKLCFGKLSDTAIKQLVSKTLKRLGIYEIKDLKVGSIMDKVISGGQRKRINIGLELIREPSILFIDEPTSGLSSRDSERIMELLKELSLKGTLVFSVIHQPSSDIFKMFDKLIILDTGGYQIYYGNPMQAITYFKGLMDRLDKDRSQCIECGNVNAEQIFNIIETKIINEYGKETHKRKILPQTWCRNFRKADKSTPIDDTPSTPLKKKLHIAGRFKQIITFTQRDFLAKISNRQYLLINLLEPITLAAILAYLVRYAAGDTYNFGANHNIPAYFLMSIIVALFMGLTVSAEEIFKDQKILKRESFLHLSRLSYLFSKVIILFSISAVQTLTYVLIGDLILDIWDMTLAYWMVLFAVSCFANILGLNISATFNSVATIYIVVPLLIIPQIILSGAVVHFDHLNSHLSSKKYVPWVGEIMASRWAFEALSVTQFKDNPYTSSFYQWDTDIHTAEYYVSDWMPTMTDYLEQSLQAIRENNSTLATQKLKVVQSEIRKQISIYGEGSFPRGWQQITPDQFNEETQAECLDFVHTIKLLHTQKRKAASLQKEAFLLQIDTPEKKEAFLKKKKLYINERLGSIVKNLSSPHHIAEENNELIQMIYPVYSKPTPENALEFRTRLFYPTKHFGGHYFPTIYFNVTIIWIMSLLLFIALYFNLLKRMLNFSRSSPYKVRK